MNNRISNTVRFASFALFAICTASALAQGEDPTFNWHFSEFFSNADGTVQFLELECNGNLDSEILATGAKFRSNSTGALFSLIGILEAPTLHKKLLLATPGFELLIGAVMPDFVLPAGFFYPISDIITLNHHGHGLVDSQTILPENPLPNDGLTSRHYLEADSGTATGFLARNSPTNFAGQAGSVDLSSGQVLPGDYNNNNVVDAADYVVWRNNLGTPSTIPNDPTSGTVTPEDYGFWLLNFGIANSGAGQSVVSSVTAPEPSACVLFLSAIAATLIRRRRG